MINQASRHFLLIGLPETGKTSFLAALWYLVSQASVDCGLTLEKLDDDSHYQYLNHIRDAWSKYKPVPRNKADSEMSVSMLLRSRSTGNLARLSFPDLSGEAFRSQWTRRELTKTYDNDLRKASGGVLFVHPEKIVKPHRIDLVNEVLDDIGGNEVKQKPKAKVKDKPWDSEKAPTQAQLVDILQFMTGRNSFRAPFRLAVVISAWDRVIPPGRRPSEWNTNQLPLLRQFLDSNKELFEISYYGVSAQGGRYALPHLYVRNFDASQPLAQKICNRTDPISVWLWSKLDLASQTVLESIREGGELTESQKKALAKDFNRVMAEHEIYDESRFAEVELRPETESLLENIVLQKEEEKLYLSRLLLEDAYPDELSRDREHAEEASDLKQKLPGVRVLVVGDGVKMPNDVTEPLQWLMR